MTDKQENGKTENIIKTKPTILPLGFRVGNANNDFYVIDFFDKFDGDLKIIESVAMPVARAKELALSIMSLSSAVTAKKGDDKTKKEQGK